MTRDEARRKEAKILNELIGKIYATPFSKKDIGYIENYIKRIGEIEIELLKETYPEATMNFYVADNEETGIEKTVYGGFYRPFAKSQHGNLVIKNNYQPQIDIYSARFFGNETVGYDNALTNPEQKNRIKAAIALTETILHEVNHYEQCLDITSDKKHTYNTLKMAEEDVLQTLYYNEVYQKNYLGMSNEIDSRAVAYRRVDDIINQFKDENGIKDANWKKEILMDSHENHLEDDELMRDTSFRFFGNDSGPQEKEFFTMQRLDKAIHEDPSILLKFPILKLEYDVYGNRRSASNLVDSYRDYHDNKKYDPQRNEMKRIYKEIITNALEMASADEIKRINEKYSSYKSLYRVLCQFNQEEQNKKIESIDKKTNIDIKKLEDELNKESDEKKRTVIRNKIEKYKNISEIKKRIVMDKYDRRIKMLYAYQNGDITVETKNEIINGVDIDYKEKIKLTDEQEKIRNTIVSEMIETYTALEDEESLIKRQNNNKFDNCLVINSVSLNRCSVDFLKKFEKCKEEGFSKVQIQDLMSVLKAADNLTLPGGRNYLEEFCNVEEIHRVILNFSQSPQWEEMKKRKLENDKNGVDKVYRKITVADFDKQTVISAMGTDQQEWTSRNMGQLLNKYSKRKCIRSDCGSPSVCALWRIAQRQQGYCFDKKDDSAVVEAIPIQGARITRQNLDSYVSGIREAQNVQVQKTR